MSVHTEPANGVEEEEWPRVWTWILVLSVQFVFLSFVTELTNIRAHPVCIGWVEHEHVCCHASGFPHRVVDDGLNDPNELGPFRSLSCLFHGHPDVGEHFAIASLHMRMSLKVMRCRGLVLRLQSSVEFPNKLIGEFSSVVMAENLRHAK